MEFMKIETEERLAWHKPSLSRLVVSIGTMNDIGSFEDCVEEGSPVFIDPATCV